MPMFVVRVRALFRIEWGIWTAFPRIMIMAMVSPMARPMPRMTLATIPDRAAGQQHPPDGLPVGGSQGESPFLVGAGQSPQGILGDADDRGQNHDPQDEGAGQDAQPRSPQIIPDEGHEDDQPPEPVDDRGNGRQQLNRRAEWPSPGWGDVNSERKTAQATPSGTPTTRAPRVTQKEPMIMGRMPKDPWLGKPALPQEKGSQPHLPDERDPFLEDEKGDQGQDGDGGEGDEEKAFFQYFLEDLFSEHFPTRGSSPARVLNSC